MTEFQRLIRELAYKWCENYGDSEHHRSHHIGSKWAGCYSPWCGNCNDGVSFAKDVVKLMIERLK